MQRRKIPLGETFGEVVAADLIDCDPGKAVVIAVAADLAFVDPVIAKGPKIEVGERIACAAKRAACRRAKPERRVSEREKKSSSVFPPHVRKEAGERGI